MLVFEGAQIAVNFREMLSELRVAGAEILARGGDHRWTESQTRGDLQRETSSRRSVQELVGRRERFWIESERRRDDAVGGRRVGFQRIVVAGGNHRRPALAEMID